MSRSGREGVSRFTIAIIGGGFAGATTAAQLLRSKGEAFRLCWSREAHVWAEA